MQVMPKGSKSGEVGRKREGRRAEVVVRLEEADGRTRNFLIGCIDMNDKLKWHDLDELVGRVFEEYIAYVDLVSQLGLSVDSIEGYKIGGIHRPCGAIVNPKYRPCSYLVGDSSTIRVQLQDAYSGSVDSLVFDTLIPKPMVQHYISLLRQHRRVVLSGPYGTGKTYAANQLALHLLALEGRPLTPNAVVTFNVHYNSSKDLQGFVAGRETVVVIVDNLHHVSSLEEIFDDDFVRSNKHCPYIICTSSSVGSPSPPVFRCLLLDPNVEPAKGFLGRYLRRKLFKAETSAQTRNTELVKIVDWITRVWFHLNRFLERHCRSNFTIGPSLFLSCPMHVERAAAWFTDVWNFSIIPYTMEAIREAQQLYGRRVGWEDPSTWVIETFPWSATPDPAASPPLLQLPCPQGK